MRRLCTLFGVAVLVMAVAVGCGKKDTAKSELPAPVGPGAQSASGGTTPASLDVANGGVSADEAYCPVMNVVRAKADMIPVEYQGKTYYVCCKDCEGKFKTDPAKWSAAADAGPAPGATSDKTTCPIMGVRKARSEMIPVTYNGKTYYVCCKDCEAQFKADPAKWSQKAAAIVGQAVSADQVTCPIMNVTKRKSDMLPVEYNGKTYYVCCKDCVSQFKADPAKWSKTAAAVAQQAASEGKVTCPIMGVTKAKSEMISVQHDGKTYYVCCKDCEQKFAAEPARWAAKAEAAGQTGNK